MVFDKTGRNNSRRVYKKKAGHSPVQIPLKNVQKSNRLYSKMKNNVFYRMTKIE